MCASPTARCFRGLIRAHEDELGSPRRPTALVCQAAWLLSRISSCASWDGWRSGAGSGKKDAHLNLHCAHVVEGPPQSAGLRLRCYSFLDHEPPVVAPHVSHFMQVPLRTSVKLPHSEHISPS
jgi:hypothetical protein